MREVFHIFIKYILFLHIEYEVSYLIFYFIINQNYLKFKNNGEYSMIKSSFLYRNDCNLVAIIT